MDSFFTQTQNTSQIQSAYQPPQQTQSIYQFDEAPQQTQSFVSSQPSFVIPASHTLQTGGSQNEIENDFNEFEQDEVTRKIRAEEERIQQILKQKSQKQYEQKNKKREEGRKQLEEYLSRKQQQKRERASENIRKESISKQDMAKLNVEAGWKKVITNINIKIGQRKGPKDINRMRQAILHRREDDKK